MVIMKVTVLSDVTTRIWARSFRGNVPAPSFGQIGINIREESAASVTVYGSRCFGVIELLSRFIHNF